MTNRIYRLSPVQAGIFAECSKDEKLSQYTLAYLFDFPPSIMPERLKKAFEMAVAAHPSLNIRLRVDGTEIVQHINEKPIEVPIRSVDDAALRTILAQASAPLELLDSPLFQIALYRSSQRVSAVIRAHHLIFDGSSTAILSRDLAWAYEGADLRMETWTMCDQAEAEVQQQGTTEYLNAEAYFENRLQGSAATRLPTINNREPEPGPLKRFSEFIDTAQINEFCERNKISPNRFFAGAIALCLSRFTREHKIVFCATHHGRSNAGLQDTIGMFVKTVPLVLNVSPELKTREFFSAVSDEIRGAWRNLTYPLPKMAEKFNISMEIAYTFYGAIKESFELNGEQVKITHLRGGTTSERLLIYILQAGNQYEVRFEFNERLYELFYIKTFAQALKNSVLNMSADVETSLAGISMLLPEEEKNILAISSGKQMDFDRTQTIVDLFRRQAGATPDATAVVFNDKRLSYHELDKESDRLAGHLRTFEVNRETVVGVMIDRSEYMAIYPLAVMKAGACYMPIDIATPRDRLAFMLKDAGVRLVLSDGTIAKDALPEFDGQILNWETIPQAVPDNADELPPPAPGDSMILLYTSGSTGTPKGCVLEHRNIVNFCRWYTKEFEITPEDRAVAYANFAFDAHIMDIFPMLTIGASVHIIPSSMRMDLPAMNQYMEENGITIAFFTTQIGRQFAEDIENHSLRLLLTGGERLIPTKKPPYRFFNLYGPTECTVNSTFFEIIANYDSSVIGRSIANVGNFIMDNTMNLLPIGVAGELCIGGEGVGRGYLNREDLTCEKFVEWRGRRLYRTGDLARYAPDGNIEYLARLDGQVKLRGLRIELGEIESVISAFQGISSAVVDIKEIGGVQHLCGYFTSKAPIDTEALKEHLRNILPEFMLPAALMRLCAFPLTGNGKVNRKLLPLPELEMEAAIPPETQLEKRMFEIVADLLKTRDFGINTNLFSLGLTSILAIKLSILFQKACGLEIKTKDILTHKTISLLAASHSTVGNVVVSRLKTYEKREYYPLTENQKGLHIEWEKNRNAIQYNIGAELQFLPSMDVNKLKQAVALMIEANPILKTTLAIREGNEVVQLRRDNFPVEISVTPTSEAMIDVLRASFVRPFNLFGDTLCRFMIVKTEAAVRLLFDIHHIIFDGGSLEVLFQDLKQAFEKGHFAKKTFTAFDWALHEEALQKTGKYSKAESYFDRLLKGVVLTEFPASGKVRSAGSAQRERIVIPNGNIRKFCKNTGLTESSFFLTLFCMTLSRFTRENQVAITMASSGRSDSVLEGAMGMFVKMLPVVVDVSSWDAVAVGKTIQDQVFASMENDLFPFAGMAARHGLSPAIVFVYQGGIEKDIALGNETASIRFLNTSITKFPLLAEISPSGNGYALELEYNTSQFDDDAILVFGRALANAARQVADAQKFALVSATEESEIMRIASGRQVEHDRGKTLVDLFRQQAARTPNNTAVVFKDRALSYGELDRVTDAIAIKLQSLGVGRETVVGVMIDRSEYMAIYPLAIMKAGGAYMPLDFSLPSERLSFMVEDAGAALILSEGTRVEDRLPGYQGPVLTREELDSLQIPTKPESSGLAGAGPCAENMFVILYTSGSTGTPKGCILEHRNIVNFCRWYTQEFEITPEDRGVGYANFAFDAHIMDIFPMLASGASVHIIPSEMRMDLLAMNRYMEEHRLSVAFMTTQIGRQFAEDIENHSLRILQVGGEKLMPTKKPPYRFINGYGPTECTIYSTFFDIMEDYDSLIIGRPLHNVECFIMDQNQELLPIGVAGELCIGGAGVGRGYLNREELTREKFFDWRGRRLYRTGDLARYAPDGNIEYSGRLDGQVKLRGLRIELGEIESVLNSFEGIASSVVAVKEHGGATSLCGYYVEKQRVDPDKLLSHLKSKLADFMVPSSLMAIPIIPLTQNGKVDRRALPLPEIAHGGEFAPPANELEKTICDAFSDVLKTKNVGALDNFFEIGGSSLSAIKLLIRLMNLGHGITYGDMFTFKTPRALAAFLASSCDKKKHDMQQLEDISDYDYQTIDRVLSLCHRNLWDKYIERPIGNILLTGATGYLGIHVLRELIEKESGKIYCLLRSKGTLSSEQRLKAQLMFYFSDTFDGLFGNRLFTVDGDITVADSLRICEERGIKTVINCAASVKHFATGDDLDRINVKSIENLIAFCQSRNARLIHISTMSSAGYIERAKAALARTFDETALHVGQIINNKYAMSKFKAERILLQAVGKGLDGKVMRVGNLMGRYADGEFQINSRSNAFVSIFKAYKALKMFPLSRLVGRVELSPIDCVARAVVSLSRAPREIAVLHPFNPYSITMADLVFAMKGHGFEIELVSDEVFAKQFGQAMQDPRKSEYMSGLLHYGVEEGFVEVPSCNDYTTTLLYKNGIRWPVIDANYSRKFIGMLDAMGFFDEES